jgi:hypothetical protein
MSIKPIFIIGSPRSGTTLLRVILDSHPNICCGPETHIIPHLEEFYKKVDENWKMLVPYGIDKKNQLLKIRELFSLFPEHYMREKKKIRWAEKTPTNIFHTDFIKKMFPDCQFIHIIRDGRDVIASFKKRWGSKTIFYGMKQWNNSINLIPELREKYGKEEYLEVRYEELVSKPEQIIRKIIEFLNEPWTPKLLEHHKQKHDYWFNVKTGENVDTNIEKKPKRHSPSKPIFLSSIGSWKKELNIFEKVIVKTGLSKNLKKMNYI